MIGYLCQGHPARRSWRRSANPELRSPRPQAQALPWDTFRQNLVGEAKSGSCARHRGAPQRAWALRRTRAFFLCPWAGPLCGCTLLSCLETQSDRWSRNWPQWWKSRTDCGTVPERRELESWQLSTAGVRHCRCWDSRGTRGEESEGGRWVLTGWL